MNTLQELNQYSTNTVLDLPDDRPAGIIVDRPLPFTPEDDTRTISSTTYVANPGLNILEIINYSTANVRYQLTIRPGSVDPLPGSTISWDSFPTSVSLTTVGNVYTLSGFKSASDWEEVKNFTWILPSDYEDYPLWFVEASIIYYDEAEDREISYDWLVYDPRFYYLAQFESTFSFSASADKIKNAVSNQSAVFSQSAEAEKIHGIINNFFNVTATMNIIGQAIPIVSYGADLSSSTSLTASGGKLVSGSINASNGSSLSIELSKLTRYSSSIIAVSMMTDASPDLDPLEFEITHDSTRNQLNITLSASSAGSIYVEWGDTTSNEYIRGGSGAFTASHTYSGSGTKNVRVTGSGTVTSSVFQVANPEASSSYCYVTKVFSWGPNTNMNLQTALQNQINLTQVPPYIPRYTTSLNGLFNGCTSFNDANLTYWNTSNITSMQSLFQECSSFNQNINLWNVSNVTNMSSLFNKASVFNQPLNSWNTGNVLTLDSTFSEASAFNQPLSNWNTSKVTNLLLTFYKASSFNQSINTWNVGNVTDMNNTFSNATVFNQPLNSWNTSKVTNMNGMFSKASAFNQPLSNWNTALVTNMNNMFSEASVFDQDISGWCVSLIPTKPSGFDLFTSASWTTAEKPVWGTCP